MSMMDGKLYLESNLLVYTIQDAEDDLFLHID